MKIVSVREDVAYLAKPNRVELVLTEQLAPVELTSTAFAVSVFRDGTILLANNQRRGLEISGGHIDPGETAEQAAIREAFEETGAVVSGVIPIGYLQMTVLAQKPDGYHYPYPVSYQQFFAARVERIEPYYENDECAAPVRVRDIPETKSTSVAAFCEEARRVLGNGLSE